MTGQAGGALHSMEGVQAYQADQLKDLEQGEGLFPEASNDPWRKGSEVICGLTHWALRRVKRPSTLMPQSRLPEFLEVQGIFISPSNLGSEIGLKL